MEEDPKDLSPDELINAVLREVPRASDMHAAESKIVDEKKRREFDQYRLDFVDMLKKTLTEAKNNPNTYFRDEIMVHTHEKLLMDPGEVAWITRTCNALGYHVYCYSCLYRAVAVTIPPADAPPPNQYRPVPEPYPVSFLIDERSSLVARIETINAMLKSRWVVLGAEYDAWRAALEQERRVLAEDIHRLDIDKNDVDYAKRVYEVRRSHGTDVGAAP